MRLCRVAGDEIHMEGAGCTGLDTADELSHALGRNDPDTGNRTECAGLADRDAKRRRHSGKSHAGLDYGCRQSVFLRKAGREMICHDVLRSCLIGEQ